jgi:microcystin-dependent protein
MWPTASAPTGYLLCAGSAVSRTTYAALFAILGTTFGAGDGSTTFNLPNYTDRMPIGAGTIAALGATGGSKDAIVVSHTHTATVTDPGHLHGIQGTNSNASTGGGISGLDPAYGVKQNTTSATTGISVANSTTGVSGTNANLPPYLGINFIIKV